VGAYNYVNELTPANPQAINGTNLIEPTSFSVDASPTVARGYARSGRAEPDVSADADPETGYLTYSPAFVQGGYGPALEGGWGGTSFVAPQLNGSTAEIDSYVGHRVGFWNPAIYGFARSWNSPFAR
jgi:subtilase family serine protease